MSSDTLTPFSHVVLVLVGEGGAGPHDLVRMAREGRMYWDAADSQYYAEPKRLARLGYLTAEKRPGKTRERTFYMLTDKGREAHDLVEALCLKHANTVELAGGINEGEFATLNKLLHRLERFWTDQVVYRL